jgi:hypothetical protein
MMGLPQVISIGGLNGTPQQVDAIGKDLAQKISAARGPTLLLVPMRSCHPILRQSLRNWVYPSSLVEELDLEFGDTTFAKYAVERLLQRLTW